MELFQALEAGKAASRLANELKGRIYTQLATVMQVEEDALHRAKVIYGSTPQTLSNWLPYISLNGVINTPVLKKGDTVLVCHPEGDGTDGVIVGTLYNAVNPPLSSDSLTVTIGDNQVVISPQGVNVLVGAENGFISMTSTGFISMVVGENELAITPDDITINNKTIATIGAVDDEGDNLVTSGWN